MICQNKTQLKQMWPWPNKYDIIIRNTIWKFDKEILRNGHSFIGRRTDSRQSNPMNRFFFKFKNLIPAASSADFCRARANSSSDWSAPGSRLIRAYSGRSLSGRKGVFVPSVPITSSFVCRFITHCKQIEKLYVIYLNRVQFFHKYTTIKFV